MDRDRRQEAVLLATVEFWMRWPCKSDQIARLNAALRACAPSAPGCDPLAYRLVPPPTFCGRFSGIEWREEIVWAGTGDHFTRDTEWDWKHGSLAQQMLICWLMCTVPDVRVRDVDALLKHHAWAPETILPAVVQRLVKGNGLLAAIRSAYAGCENTAANTLQRDTLRRALRSVSRGKTTNPERTARHFLSGRWQPLRRELLLGALLRHGDPTVTRGAIADRLRELFRDNASGRRGEPTLRALRMLLSERLARDWRRALQQPDVGLWVRARQLGPQCAASAAPQRQTQPSPSPRCMLVLLAAVSRNGDLVHVRLEAAPPGDCGIRARAEKAIDGIINPTTIVPGPSRAGWTTVLSSDLSLPPATRRRISAQIGAIIERAERWLFRETAAFPISSARDFDLARESTAAGRRALGRIDAVQRELAVFAYMRTWDKDSHAGRERWALDPLFVRILDPKEQRCAEQPGGNPTESCGPPPRLAVSQPSDPSTPAAGAPKGPARQRSGRGPRTNPPPGTEAAQGDRPAEADVSPPEGPARGYLPHRPKSGVPRWLRREDPDASAVPPSPGPRCPPQVGRGKGGLFLSSTESPAAAKP